MPLYPHQCSDCGATQDVYRAIRDIEDAPPCPKCGTRMTRVIGRTHVIADIQPYMTVAADKETGKRQFITSRAKHREFLKKNGYEELGNEKPDLSPKPASTAGDSEDPSIPFNVFD